MTSEKMSLYAPVVVRIGISLVLLWFGMEQLTNTDAWTGIIPTWATELSGMDASMIVIFNGVFEIVFALISLIGFFTRPVALLLALHLMVITGTMGYTGIGVRDFGLTMAAISIFLYGPDIWSLDTYLVKRRK